jgi:ATP-dependent DNA helicase RecQ
MVAAEALERALRERFGHGGFRAGQRDVAEAVLAGRDVVAVMPTGAGKSLCYQLPATLLEGTTVVVSPLIALMKDQVDALQGLGVAAAAIHSGLSLGARRQAEAALAHGAIDLLYVAPERLARPAFVEALRRATVARLVVDEAHCISQWGHDFRPDYRRLGGLRATLGVPAAAFTATATPDVRADIAAQLRLDSPVELVTGFERPNLTLAVHRCRTRAERLTVLEDVVRELGGPGLVYVATRRAAEFWSGALAQLGLRSAAYHAGLGDAERTRIQETFLAGKLDAIAATNAFGMGIDKPDIRFVLHAEAPGSIEAYYQEAGRAGRDGKPARCTLLFSGADLRTQEFFLEGANPAPGVFHRVWKLLGEAGSDEEIEDSIATDAAQRMAAATAARLLRQGAESAGVALGEGEPPIDLSTCEDKRARDRRRLEDVIRYATSRGCRTRFIYDYFAGTAAGGAVPRCGTCDVCLGWKRRPVRPVSDEEFQQVRIALSAVARLRGRFGVERVAQVLTGSRAAPVLERRLDRLPTYGKLSAVTIDAAKRLLEVLADAGLLERCTLEGGPPGAFVLRLTAEGVAVMKGEARPDLPLPARTPRATAASSPGRRPSAAAAPPPRPGTEDAADDVDPDILARLKAWRTETAAARGVPAYVVFHDATLAEIAARRPTTTAELREIRGVGPTKIEQYGEALLTLLT